MWDWVMFGQILWCFFTASLLWMAKVLFVKTAANSFHRAAYFDRIQDCLFHQYVLETISQPKTVDTDDYWGMAVKHEENKVPEKPPNNHFVKRLWHVFMQQLTNIQVRTSVRLVYN